jgi:glycosyltransferase involved in cell wall biosynthesis
MSLRVSVVVPAFRNAEYLAMTLDSILAQDYDD